MRRSLFISAPSPFLGLLPYRIGRQPPAGLLEAGQPSDPHQPTELIAVAPARQARHPAQAMATLLVVHHTTSPHLQAMFEAVMSGATDEAIQGVTVLARPALAAAAVDVLEADGYLLGTPANIGYMSGALKHFFDQVYYPCLDATVRRPYGLYVHGNSDTTGAVRAVEGIAQGLQWRRAQAPVAVLGTPSAEDLRACWELGAALAAGLTLPTG
jgi:NAD(P)H-dependent FMN reductase